MDSIRSGRPGSSSKFSTSQPGPSSRTSVLSSVVPYLRRMDGDDSPAHHKQPLLTLKLSSSTFLDSFVTDDVTEQPLYTIRTVGITTTIKRADPWDGDTRTAEIKWPKTAPAKGKGISDGVLIQMRGLRWKGSETLLKRGSILSGPRKFNIPNYSQNLKWRRVGNSYWCTTAAVKGPIAILDPAVDSLPPRLNVFETLHDKYDARPMLVHHGVSILLLDYLLVTALFLVTDVQDWMLVKKFEDIVIPIGNPDNLPGMSPPKSAPGNISTSNLQWRKIMYGEPLFPKRSSHSSMSSGSTTPDVLTPTPLSAEQMAKVAYGHPLYPTLRSSSPAPSTSGSEDTSDHMFFSPTLTRPTSPSAESIFYPLSRGSAPSHTYLDPSFYNENDIPPVPPIPVRFSTSPTSNRNSRSRPSSSHSTSSRNGGTRRLPELPVPPVPPLIPRPRSTPPRPMTSPTTAHEQANFAASGSRRPLDPATTPRRPSRQLPQPPTMMTSTAPMPLPVRTDSRFAGVPMARARSHSQSHSLRGGEKWPHQAYGQRTLPSPPTSSSRARDRDRNTDQRDSSDGGPYLKNAEDWVGIQASGAAYDIPPPAYNSINFSPRVEDLPGPAAAAASPPT
ncbi:hypothetical protein D9615_002634 [Tricholomella constricta]|uniref:Uncharacterized protein n=1 Tax=Tricholomella constricta TaxID=117010 RepID=A0A8H5HNG7_9AGAR|nr:hypothetical protein D9615_002634 [Tricholomella constricta]